MNVSDGPSAWVVVRPTTDSARGGALRSRIVIPDIDFREFHEHELPHRLASGHGALAAADAIAIGALAIRTDAGAYTYRGSVGDDARGTIEIVEGDAEARTVIGIDLESWRGLVSDLETPPGLFYANRVEAVRGNPMRFVRWEPALRAMFHGRPIYDPATIQLRDRAGAPLDTAASFTLADLDPGDDVRHFLATSGYLWVRDVFGPDEIDALLGAAHQLADEACEGDGGSWWGRNASGDAVLCRVLTAARIPVMRALHDDPRVAAIVAMAHTPLVKEAESGPDAVTVLWKRPNVTEGLADLPWHRDCGMGGHAAMCPTFVMTICLTDGSPGAGELRFLPGSHTMSHPFIDGRDAAAPRGVSVPVQAGDVTIHCGDVMHVSMPPEGDTGPFRISVLLGFVPTDARHHRGERHYNDVLLGRDDGQVEHLTAIVTRER